MNVRQATDRSDATAVAHPRPTAHLVRTTRGDSTVPATTTVLVADSHPMIVHGLRETIAADRRLSFAGNAGNGEEAVEAFRRSRPDVVVLDIQLSLHDGIETTRRIRALDPDARVVVFTSLHGEEDIRKAIQAGAIGYLLKTASEHEVIACIVAAAEGRTSYASEVGAQLASWVASDALSTRELQILRLVAEGLCNKTIARVENITEGTTKSHLKHIFRKLGVSSRTAAVHAAMKRGVVRLS